MKNLILILTLLLFSNNTFSYPKTPKIDISPGELCTVENKDFSYLRYKEKIPYCKRNVSTKTKNEVCALYDVHNRRDYTVDHIIPLSLGGSNSKKNLWCQSRKIYSGHLEFWLYSELNNDRTRHVETIVYILSHKYNPKGKDHVPCPPGTTPSSKRGADPEARDYCGPLDGLVSE